MWYCSLDLETTGIDPEHCDVIEIGAVIDRCVDPLSDADRPEFHCYVKEDLYTGEPYGLSMHAATFKRIAKEEGPYHYWAPFQAIRELELWFEGNWNRVTGTKKVLFAGKNFGSFDLEYLKRMPGFDEQISYEHGMLDPGPLYFNPKKDKKIPNLEACLKRADLVEDVTHTALQDAIQVSKVIQAYYA